MFDYKKHILVVVFFLSFSTIGQAQNAKWTNKDKGTFAVSYSYMPIIPADNPRNIGISIKMYELTENGCKPIEGWAKINGRSYFVYDSTWVMDKDGDKNLSHYFKTLLEEGIYQIKGDAGNEYYPVKTSEFNLIKGASYRFSFYFVRKDALKRN